MKHRESKQPVQEENGPAVELHLGPGSLDANRWGGLHVGPDDDAKWAQKEIRKCNIRKYN